jgi:RHS repeat-associated protein
VYLYTADDERIAVTNQTRTSWQWTLRGTDHKPLRELKETVSGSTRQWNWVRDYVYADGTLLAAYTNHPTPARTLQHYHLDHLGTPRLITDSNGSEITRDELFPFGEDPSFNIADPERLHFTGHERDYDGGTSVANGDSLDYMHARYYSPTLGRFLSVDPEMNIANALREPQQWNRYSYVVNNPLKYADPDGRDKFMAWLLGDAFRDVSTWDALKGALSTGPMVRAVDEGRQEWAEDHRAATRGFSPVPTTREEIAMAPVFMMLGPGGGAARTTLAEAKTLIGAWGKGTFSTLAKTIGYHFEKHGAEVGAKSMLQYLRKAYEFNRNLRGAEKVALENGATRYIKNGYYIIKDETGRILSYGRVAQ